MKKIFSIVSAFMLLWSSVAFAQATRTVTINVQGNRTKQIAVDSRNYSIDNTSISSEKSIEITGLANGQHQLNIYRTNLTSPTTTSFTLREGYDLEITINANGGISLNETRVRENQHSGVQKPMSSVAFNRLYKSTKAKTSSSARTSFLLKEFDVNNRYFTSAQAKQLIQLVNSESSRLKLAKAVYPMITDEANFSQVVNLLNSTSNRAELNDYIASLEVDEDTNTAYVPMSAEKFNEIYNEVVAENTLSDRNYYLINFFSKDFNYYTSSQVRQLLQLINSETERLNLAKSAYRGITDRENYYNSIYPILNSTSNRNELKSYITSFDANNTGNTGNVKTAMSASAFNTLYRNIYYQSSGAKYNSINTAFNTTGNYFTSAQVRQLISLVTDENSRLSLAKAAYPTMVDPANYTVLNDLFNYQSTRNEFANFVATYNGTTPTGTKTAMSASAYNTLYQNIYYQNSGEKYNSIYNAFTTTGNYFTSAQVRQLINLVSDENSRLSLAKAAYPTMVDPANYTVLNDLFNYESSRNELASFVANYNGTTNPTGSNMAMSEAEFNTLYRNINNQWTSANRFTQASTAFQSTTNRFSVAQVKQILLLLTTESDRLSLAKMAYDNMVDQYNYLQVSEVFSSNENKSEWTRYVTDIQNGGTGTSYRTAMSASEYNSLLRSVQLTFGFGAKMSALTDIFNKETNYFTVAQIKELVSMVSNESNRLELAKLAYNNSVDPTNYSNMYDLFTSQTSLDELKAYINSSTYR